MILKILVLCHTEGQRCNSTVTRIIGKEFFDAILLCGVSDYRKVLNLDRRVFGIPLLEDDIYIIRILKEKGSYIAGTWHQIERSLCIGGIDSRNPFQNAERLKHQKPSECKYAIILSSYMPKHSMCSKVRLLNKEVNIGFAPLSTLASEFQRVLIISCTSNIEKEVCMESFNKNALLIATKRSVIQVTVNMSTLEVEVV